MAKKPMMKEMARRREQMEAIYEKIQSRESAGGRGEGGGRES